MAKSKKPTDAKKEKQASFPLADTSRPQYDRIKHSEKGAHLQMAAAAFFGAPDAIQAELITYHDVLRRQKKPIDGETSYRILKGEIRLADVIKDE